MTYIPYPDSYYCLEAESIDAGVKTDLIRGNLEHLARQPPACGGRFLIAAERVERIGVALWYRSSLRQIRCAVDQPLRNIEVRARMNIAIADPGPGEWPPPSASWTTWFAQVTRFWNIQGASGGTHLYQEDSWSSQIHGYTDVERTITLEMRLPYALTTQYGSGGDGRGDAWYYWTRIRVGQIESLSSYGDGGITPYDIAWREVDPVL